ncbi:hypothetical protein BTJ39_18755 [Izhakiella australiensis]|uniref:Uncharacterized protein n=1 Tax=Izhakiella australiensis TaxID=1926881 RepID=A0A1S8YHF7_9GAMM|nr:hypothetical protein [Izhakiella australiensis]OON38491.1 hypothetical protein BTJ39_18755 [Izhakiella australiensis]
MLSIFFLPLPDALVRYLPGERVSYQTEFDYTFPGPSRGKSGRCEMGLKIKDKSLKRWIVVCSSRAWLDAHFQRGMDRINVVEKVNRYGVQLESYQLDWSPIGMRSRTGISYPNDVY